MQKIKDFFYVAIGTILVATDLFINQWIVEYYFFRGPLSEFRLNLWLKTSYRFSQFVKNKYLDSGRPAGYIEFIKE